MWNIKHIYHKNKGFSLIELILTLAICSMIIVPLYSILDFSAKSSKIGEEKDELMLNARYAIEFVKGEIKFADKIIATRKIEGLKSKYPTNIGFVIFSNFTEDKVNLTPYRYITYHINGDRLVRLSCNLKTDRYPSVLDFNGRNDICEFIDTIENTQLYEENPLISLDFKFKNSGREKLDLNTDIYIRCPVDY